MKRLLIVTAAALATTTPAIAGLVGNPSFSHRLPVRVPAQAQVVSFDDRGQHPEPGDDRGRHSEPGDDRGGQSSAHSSLTPTATPSRTPEPGDDHGSTSTEPGDDHSSASAEPGDDHGGSGSGRGGSGHGGGK